MIACTNAYKKNCMQNIKSSWRQTKYHGKNNTAWTKNVSDNCISSINTAAALHLIFPLS